ncbi:CAAX prenyl protease 2-like isoform X1 [Zingiber officinale]|uniref:CAAX prenyl protease 2-like isoform X1 n=1 Tax=Zingiber officinale TaxID=94328 RepID=UPI001C4B728F|nr:CAAX prenyl protease 2-like isoform X1 [Zingiber officinale]
MVLSSSSAMDPYVFDPSPAVASAVSVSGGVAVAACASMAFFYVATLYSPTVIFRLPPPASLDSFIIRRFACAAVSSVASVVACGFLLGLGRLDDFSSVLGVFGVRSDHLCQAVFFPLLLTSLLYGGSFVSKTWKLIASRKESSRENSCSGFDMCVLRCMDWITAYARNVMAWRNYVVAPFTEELVFRACMIPLLLCGGFGTSSIIFLTPVFFSLAHLNHFLELYYQRRYRFTKAFLIVGLQLGYTVIFGWFASFLFIRTGNLISPIVAHVFCNVMGLPVLSCPRTKGLATLAAAAGVLCFLWLLFPATSPYLYNDLRDGCSCWHRYCSWS